jgi:hypothetical protein
MKRFETACLHMPEADRMPPHVEQQPLAEVPPGGLPPSS